MTSPNIFDRPLIRRRLARAAASAAPPDFLLRHAAAELAARVAVVRRPFSLTADLGSYDGAVARFLRGRHPEIRMLTLTPVLPLARQAPWPGVVASEEALPLKEGAFDLITSALSLHLVNDLPGALIQIRRALKPDGLFLGALLGGDSLIELRQSFMIAEAESLGGASPRVMPAVDLRAMGGLLQRAGFALPVTDSEQLTVTYRDALALMRELRAMGAANALSLRSRKMLRKETLARASAVYAREASMNGRVKATFEILYISGWAPHESQQRPLRPGSAVMRLADALHTVEIPAGDKAAFGSESGETG